MRNITFHKSKSIPGRNEDFGFEWGTPLYDNHGFIDKHDNEIIIAGKSFAEWEKDFGLPLHIIFAPIMIQNVRNFKSVFKNEYPKGEIRYAGKVNSHPSIFRLMSMEGIGADVASINELRSALRGGIDPKYIDVNGNAKDDELIDTAVGKNMFFIADSYKEMETINIRAKNLNKNARVVLRLSGFKMNQVTDANVFTAGVWSKFGEFVDNIPEIIKNLYKFTNLDFQGFHTHIGSQISEPDPYLEAFGVLVEFGHLLKESGVELKVLNIGGGFPVNYVNKEEWQYLQKRVEAGYINTKGSIDKNTFVWNNETGGLGRNKHGEINPHIWPGEKMYSEYPKHNMLEKILKGETSINGTASSIKDALASLGNPSLVIEPGRSIAEDSGITLARVSHVRNVAGKHNLTTLEANVTSFATAMLLPPVNPWTIMNDPFRTDDKPFETFLAGNLCYSGDIISKYKVFLQRVLFSPLF
jgi:diaminopimelate decarboxylase